MNYMAETSSWCFICIQFIRLAVGLEQLPACGEADFQFDYTRCDKNGLRWRVAFPKSEKCAVVAKNVPLPARGQDCTFQCKAGTFLNLKSQQCEDCSPGSYSLGAGTRYENFQEIPSGFQIETRSVSGGFVSQHSDIFDSPNCTDSGWQPLGGYLFYAPTPRCISRLAFSAELETSGEISFVYFYPDDDATFKFTVQSEQCMSFKDSLFGSKGYKSQLKATPNGRWGRERVAVKPGQTVFSWEAVSYFFMTRPILIKTIEILGTGYSTSCTKCPPGTFAPAGSSNCTVCGQNTYSSANGEKCIECAATEFSEPRSTKCIKRQPCTADDYNEVFVPCVGTTLAHIEYRWIAPKICDENLTGSAILPPPKMNLVCVGCSPGMFVNDKGECAFCSKDKYSNGSSSTCVSCPSSKLPSRGYYFSSWSKMPQNVKVSCETVDDLKDACKDIPQSWQLFGDRIRTAHTRHYNVYLTLVVSVPEGFLASAINGEASEENPVASIRIDFELKCGGICQLVLLENSPSEKDKEAVEIYSWNGTVKRSVFEFSISKSAPTEFILAFYRTFDITAEMTNFVHDEAILYAFNVTNTVGGGAWTCLPCPKQGLDGRCQFCPLGYFVEEKADSSVCQKCPADTYLNTSYSVAVGRNSCVSCGENLHSADGIVCSANCSAITIGNKHYDFSLLSKTYRVRGVQLFSTDGAAYFHMFNFSVCTNVNAWCYQNSSYSFGFTEVRNVSSLFCRETVIPSAATGDSLVLTNPFSIADKLVEVSSAKSVDGLKVNEEFLGKTKYSDVHFFYKSSTKLVKCANGRGAVVTLRCDPLKEASEEVKLPPMCPGGTCDGCVYHVLILSKHACPLCTKDDYDEFPGPCVNGKQNISIIPNSQCVISGFDKLATKTVHCSVLTFTVQVVIAVASAAALLLLVFTVSVWKKNKKLEYKYMKLVESSHSKDGAELPAAESCALDEGEEEEAEDKVTFSKGSKKFLRLKSSGGKRDSSLDHLVSET